MASKVMTNSAVANSVMAGAVSDAEIVAQFRQRGCWGLYTSVDLKGCDPASIRDAEKIHRFIIEPVSYTHLRAHETVLDLVCLLLLAKKKKHKKNRKKKFSLLLTPPAVNHHKIRSKIINNQPTDKDYRVGKKS